jgi:hypothetical protein
MYNYAVDFTGITFVDHRNEKYEVDNKVLTLLISPLTVNKHVVNNER